MTAAASPLPSAMEAPTSSPAGDSHPGDAPTAAGDGEPEPVLIHVEAQRAAAILLEVVEKLAFLGAITPDVMQVRGQRALGLHVAGGYGRARIDVKWSV
jgi:hypothetical protein